MPSISSGWVLEGCALYFFGDLLLASQAGAAGASLRISVMSDLNMWARPAIRPAHVR